MAKPAQVKVTGLRELVKSLEQAGTDVSDLKESFRKIGDLVGHRAASLAPKRSGALAASIRPSRAKSKASVRAGSKKVPYAGVINYGWPARHIEPSNFLKRAAEESEGQAVDLMKQEISGIIRKLDLN